MIYGLIEGMTKADYLAKKEKEKQEEKNKYRDPVDRSNKRINSGSEDENTVDIFGNQIMKRNMDYFNKISSANRKADQAKNVQIRTMADYDKRIAMYNDAIKDNEDAKRIANNIKNMGGNNLYRAIDAIDRHNRRHPDRKLEQTIFESIQFI